MFYISTWKKSIDDGGQISLDAGGTSVAVEYFERCDWSADDVAFVVLTEYIRQKK